MDYTAITIDQVPRDVGDVLTHVVSRVLPAEWMYCVWAEGDLLRRLGNSIDDQSAQRRKTGKVDTYTDDERLYPRILTHGDGTLPRDLRVFLDRLQLHPCQALFRFLGQCEGGDNITRKYCLCPTDCLHKPEPDLTVLHSSPPISEH